MKPALRLKHLRKEVQVALDKRLSHLETQNLPWYLLRRLVMDHTENLDTTLRDLLLNICDKKDVAGYFDLQSLNTPTAYSGCAHSVYQSAAAVLSFLKKYPFGKVANLDPLSAAERSFDRAERLCRITNRRLRWFRHRGFRLQKHRPGLHGIFHAARLKISSWLGPVDLNKIYDQSQHGPGGALGVEGLSTTAYYKYAAPLYTVTPRAKPYAVAAILADQQWRRYVVNPEAILGDPVPSTDEAFLKAFDRLKVTTYNKVTFVPKTALTHRAIAIEPLMNIYLQLGAGAYIRDTLRRVGINLRDQTRNQNLALIGSTDRRSFYSRPATLDLSMASDTLSVELARELLPEDWFNLLSDLRSEEGVYKGKTYRWAKFCSMGNGFAFPLESLIFYALVSAVIDETGSDKSVTSVYGDDIIVPGNATLRVIEVLNYAGFKVNTEKSFAFGPFRESCGKDFWEGRDVRPFFLKKKIKRPNDLLLCRNTHFLSGDAPSVVDFIDRRLPKCIADNLLGPVTQDLVGHLFFPWDAAQKSRLVSWNKSLQSWSYVSVKQVARYYSGHSGPILLQIMNGIRFSGFLQTPEDDSYGRNRTALNTPFLGGLRDRYLLAQ